MIHGSHTPAQSLWTGKLLAPSRTSWSTPWYSPSFCSSPVGWLSGSSAHPCPLAPRGATRMVYGLSGGHAFPSAGPIARLPLTPCPSVGWLSGSSAHPSPRATRMIHGLSGSRALTSAGHIGRLPFAPCGSVPPLFVLRFFFLRRVKEFEERLVQERT